MTSTGMPVQRKSSFKKILAHNSILLILLIIGFWFWWNYLYVFGEGVKSWDNSII